MRGGARERIPQGYREQGEQVRQVRQVRRESEERGERGRGRDRQSGVRPGRGEQSPK